MLSRRATLFCGALFFAMIFGASTLRAEDEPADEPAVAVEGDDAPANVVEAAP